MRRAMHKSQDPLFKRFSSQLMLLNSYLPPLHESSDANKMAPENLNKIILHADPNVWAKQSYIQVHYFKGKTYNDTCKMFDCIETA